MIQFVEKKNVLKDIPTLLYLWPIDGSKRFYMGVGSGFGGSNPGKDNIVLYL